MQFNIKNENKIDMRMKINGIENDKEEKQRKGELRRKQRERERERGVEITKAQTKQIAKILRCSIKKQDRRII